MAALLSWKARWGLVSTLLAVVFVLGQLLALFIGLKILLPNVWTRQIEAGWPLILGLFLSISVSTCFVEWFVHRDILHKVIVSYFRDICRRHERHHGLTLINLKRSETAGMAKIVSRYPIVKFEQNESVSFPDYMLVLFFVFYSVPLGLLQCLFPSMPFLLAGYTAVACSYGLYEVFHPLEHKSDEWWEARIKNPIARMLQYYLAPIRRFHEYHHLNTNYNMAIVGFFGIPLADMVFGTYKTLAYSLDDGSLMSFDELRPSQPGRFVKKHDHWAEIRSRRLIAELMESGKIIND